MGLIKDFQAYLNEVKDQIEGINSVRIVTEKGQLSEILREHQKSENALLLAIMPNFSNNAPASADEYMDLAFAEINVLKKTDYSNLPYSVFIDEYDQMFDLIQQVKAKLLADHLDQSCNLVRMLEPSSIITTDVYNETQCNGWNMTFSFNLRV